MSDPAAASCRTSSGSPSDSACRSSRLPRRYDHHPLEPGQHDREFLEPLPAPELLDAVDDDLDPQHARAFVVHLQRQSAEVDLEHRQVASTEIGSRFGSPCPAHVDHQEAMTRFSGAGPQEESDRTVKLDENVDDGSRMHYYTGWRYLAAAVVRSRDAQTSATPRHSWNPPCPGKSAKGIHCSAPL